MVSTSIPTARGRTRLPPPFHVNGQSGPRSAPLVIQRPGKGEQKSWLTETWGEHMRLQLGGAAEITRPLEENPWLHACSTAMATAVASVRMRIYAVPPGQTGDDDLGKEVTDESDPIFRLLNAPNRFDVWVDFAKRGVFHRIGQGEDWWFLAGPDNKPVAVSGEGRIATPTQIIQASGACVEDIGRDQYGMPTGWRYTATTGNAPDYPVGAVLSFLDPDPYDRFRGLGPAEVLARELGQYFQAQRYIEGLARNGGELGGILKLPTGISDAEVQATQAKLDDVVTNGERRGRYLAIGADADFIPNGITPKDMEFKSLFEWVRECICSATHVPPPVIGIYTDATYNNVRTAHAEFWRTGVVPYLRSIEAVLNFKFFPRLADTKLAAYRVYFDVSDIEALQEDNTAKIEAAARVSSLLAVPFNASLALFGVDAEVEGGDEAPEFGFSEPEEPDPKPDDPDDDPETDPEDEDRAAPVALTRANAPLAERAARVEYWESLERRLRLPAERLLKAKSETYLKRYLAAQLARLRAFARNGKNLKTATGRAFAADFEALIGVPIEARDIAIDDAELARQAEILLLNKQEWEAKLVALFDKPLQSVASAALSAAAAETGGASIGVGHPRILEALSRQKIQLAEGVTSTLANRVRTRLMEELSKATSIGDLQAKVQEILPELEGTVRQAFSTIPQRALTIARTEAGHAIGKSRFEQFKADGVTQLQWITEGDANVRPSHQQVDGDVVPIGETFSNGLRYAHDENGPVEEVANCRCATLPVMEP